MSNRDSYKDLLSKIGKVVEKKTEGKDLSEVFKTIKDNASSLSDPKKMADMLELVKGKSPTEIKDLLKGSLNNISEEDLEKAVGQIIKQDGFNEVFDSKVKEQKQKKWKSKADEIKERRLAKERGEEIPAKKDKGNDLVSSAAKLLIKRALNKQGPKN